MVVEVVVNIGLVLIIGEIIIKVKVNYIELVRKKIVDIGYIYVENGFFVDSCLVLVVFDE